MSNRGIRSNTTGTSLIGGDITGSSVSGSKFALDVYVRGGSASGGGTEYTDGDAIDTDSLGTLLIGTTDVSGTARAVITDDDGHLQVDILSSALPAGAATSANQLADNHQVTISNASLPVTQSGSPWDVQGPDADGAAITGNPVLIGGENGSGNIQTIQTAPDGDLVVHIHTDSFSFVDNVSNTQRVQVAEDDTTFFPTPTFPFMFDGTTWDRVRGTSADGLLVNLGSNNDVSVTGSVTTGSEYAEDSGHTTGDTGTMTLAVRNDSSASLVDTDLDYAPLQVDSLGRLKTRPLTDDSPYQDTIMISDGTVNGPVTLTTGKELRVKDETMDSKTPASLGSKTQAASFAVTLATDEPARDINDITGTISLPTGAATAANQLPDGHNVTVDNGAGVAAVNIQDGGNSITVDGTVTANQGGAPWDVQGDVAHDAADSGNPILVGGRAHTSEPAAVANSDRVRAYFDENGYQRIKATPRRTSVSNLTALEDTYDNTTSTNTSASVDVQEYRSGRFYWDAEVGAGTPTEIIWDVEFSHDDTNWYKHREDFWHNYRFTDSTISTGFSEAATIKNLPNYIRFVVTTTGVDASNTFIVNDAYFEAID